MQDSWKVNRRLTLELGLAHHALHSPGWIDSASAIPIFDYSKYNSSCPPTDYCGFLWNKRDPSVPLGGFPTRAAFWQPRFGVAYDLFGKGKTVLRGGWGRYYYHSGQFTTGLDVSAGVQSVGISTSTLNIPVSSYLSPGISIRSTSAARRSRRQRSTARTTVSPTPTATASRSRSAFPGPACWKSPMSATRARTLPTQRRALSNINLVPVGAMLGFAEWRRGSEQL